MKFLKRVPQNVFFLEKNLYLAKNPRKTIWKDKTPVPRHGNQSKAYHIIRYHPLGLKEKLQKHHGENFSNIESLSIISDYKKGQLFDLEKNIDAYPQVFKLSIATRPFMSPEKRNGPPKVTIRNYASLIRM